MKIPSPFETRQDKKQKSPLAIIIFSDDPCHVTIPFQELTKLTFCLANFRD